LSILNPKNGIRKTKRGGRATSSVTASFGLIFGKDFNKLDSYKAK
jgi:hypothetical protein